MLDVLWERLVEIYDPDTLQSIKGPTSLYGGFLIGVIWGIVLQKSRVCKYDVVSNLFRFQDFTVFRVGTPLLMAGMVFIYLFKDMGMIELAVPKTVVLPQILGGLLFGAAIAILGYCPGTGAVAVGEGALDAIPGILGMITGSVIFAEFFYDSWKDSFLKIGDLGRVTIPDLLGVNHWFVIVPLLLLMTMFLVSTTMVDWFLQLAVRLSEYFGDVGVGVEKTITDTSKKLTDYFKDFLTAVRKLYKGTSAGG